MSIIFQHKIGAAAHDWFSSGFIGRLMSHLREIQVAHVVLA